MKNKNQKKSVRINCLISEKLVQLRMPVELHNRLQQAVELSDGKTHHQIVRYAIRERSRRMGLLEFVELDAKRKNISVSAVIFMSLSAYLDKLEIQ